MAGRLISVAWTSHSGIGAYQSWTASTPGHRATSRDERLGTGDDHARAPALDRAGEPDELQDIAVALFGVKEDRAAPEVLPRPLRSRHRAARGDSGTPTAIHAPAIPARNRHASARCRPGSDGPRGSPAGPPVPARTRSSPRPTGPAGPASSPRCPGPPAKPGWSRERRLEPLDRLVELPEVGKRNPEVHLGFGRIRLEARSARR